MGRFAQADTLIPEPGNPLAWDRYAYVLNNPVRYADPSGHYICEGTSICRANTEHLLSSDELASRVLDLFDVTLENWGDNDTGALIQAINDVGTALAGVLGGNKSASHAFRSVYGPIAFYWGNSRSGLSPECRGIGSYGCTSSRSLINFMSMAEPTGNRSEALAFLLRRNNVVHELGHAFAHTLTTRDAQGNLVVIPYSAVPGRLVSMDGWPEPPEYAERMWRQSIEETGTRNEVFADMFLGWTYDTWATSPLGTDRRSFMSASMSIWALSVGGW